MAFDEEFHVGIIKIYAQHWLPFLPDQPSHADQFGAVARDPSFLYHYLMSFPYRMLTVLSQSETIHVIVLRLMNVALFTAGLVLFVRVMRALQMSPALVNVSLAIFVLIPIVPQLAAHINYDNALMILVPAFCLLAFRLFDESARGRISIVTMLAFVNVAVYMSIIKYAALPFAVSGAVFAAIILYLNRGAWRAMLTRKALLANLTNSARPVVAGMLVLLVIGSVFFAQRYGGNIARYHTPVPACDQVLTVQQCSKYGPWQRDYLYEKNRPAAFKPSAISFMKEWVNGMWRRIFFAVAGPTNRYATFPGLPIPRWTGAALAAASGIVLLVYWRSVFWGDKRLFFLTVISVTYVAALWLTEYKAYRHTGEPVAINGRYLLPILPFVAIAIGRAFSRALRSVPGAKAPLATIVVLLFMCGGGVGTFILRSNTTWYWPNHTVVRVNDAAKKVLSPLVMD